MAAHCSATFPPLPFTNSSINVVQLNLRCCSHTQQKNRDARANRVTGFARFYLVRRRSQTTRFYMAAGPEALPIGGLTGQTGRGLITLAAMGKPTETAVIIVGGGPSGLATAAYLRHLSIPYTLLEREDCFAPLWQKYSYDRVHLHLAKQFCELPLMPIPTTYPTYLSREEFIQYLNDYVSRFSISPTYRRSVETAMYDETVGKWRIKARNLVSDEVEDYCSRFLVVATGETCDASVPEIGGLESFMGEVLHSTKYRNGKKFGGKNVLVVGSGNSGMEIALDLANSGAKTSIVVRSPIHIVSRAMIYAGVVLVTYLPFNWVDSIVTMMSKVVYGDLTKYGIQRPKEGPFTVKTKYGKFPVIDVGTLNKIKSGEIQVLPGIRSIKGNKVLFENGSEYPYDVIVFATGFKRSTKQWLKEDDYLLGEDGFAKPSFPNHWKGKNGLYCVGLARRGLYGAAMDAKNIAHDIKNLYDSTIETTY